MNKNASRPFLKKTSVGVAFTYLHPLELLLEAQRSKLLADLRVPVEICGMFSFCR